MSGRTLPEFAVGFFHAFAAILISSHYLSKEMTVAGATGLLALATQRNFARALEENRADIWEREISPWRANEELIRTISVLFLGVFSGAFGIFLILGSFGKGMAFPVPGFQAASCGELFLHNFAILLPGVLLSLLYQAGGLALIIGWNAINWALIICNVVVLIHDSNGLVLSLLGLATILPHLVLETVAYILGGASGIFMSKGLVKYRLSSREFERVSSAAFLVFMLAIFTLALAAFVESYLAYPALRGVYR